jgi:hypothetical protein
VPVNGLGWWPAANHIMKLFVGKPVESVDAIDLVRSAIPAAFDLPNACLIPDTIP